MRQTSYNAHMPTAPWPAGTGDGTGALDTLVVSVPAMDCPEEVTLLEKAWEHLEGVLEVRPNLLDRTATVILDPHKTSPSALLEALAHVGLQAEFTTPGAPPEVQFYIPSYDQPETVPAIKKALEQDASVTDMQFDDVERVVRITFDPRFLSVAGVQQILQSTGVVFQQVTEGTPRPALPSSGLPDHARQVIQPFSGQLRTEPESGIFVAPPEDLSEPPATALTTDPRLIGIALGVVLWGIGVLLLQFPDSAIVGKVVLGLTALMLGWRTFRRALRSALSRHLDMHVLMSAATLGALGIGEWAEAAMLMILFSLSLWVEGWNLDRARNAVRAFRRRQPPRVRIFVDGTWDQVPIERVGLGTLAEVRPGEIIPLDGRVVSGAASVDESTLTGEATPVHKTEGHQLFAGTICQNGVLQYRVTHLLRDSTLQRLQQLVLDAQATRAPLQGTVDRFAKTYTPAVLGIALVVALIPPLIGLALDPSATPAAKAAIWHTWFYRSLGLLVLACPCALVISTPVAFVAALGRAAHLGMLIKGGKALEAVGQLKAMAFDKTGTLTTGELELVQVEGYGVTHTEALQLAMTLEQTATHPVALAILHAARKEELAPLRNLTDFHQAGGKGVEGRLGQHTVHFGSIPWLLDERGLALTEELGQRLQEAGAWQATLIGLQSGNQLIGLFAFRDPMRPEAPQVISSLRSLGLQRLEMLTGDNPKVAELVGNAAGLDAFHANLLPEDKPMRIRGLIQAYQEVGMVGDGLNDAPALANATVGIAMGARGVDVAMESADIVLLGEDLEQLPQLVRLSRQTMDIIRQNILLALAIKGVFLLALSVGWFGLWAAVLGDMGGSLAVTANSLRLLRRTP